MDRFYLFIYLGSVLKCMVIFFPFLSLPRNQDKKAVNREHLIFYLKWTFMTGHWPWNSIRDNEGQQLRFLTQHAANDAYPQIIEHFLFHAVQGWCITIFASVVSTKWDETALLVPKDWWVWKKTKTKHECWS